MFLLWNLEQIYKRPFVCQFFRKARTTNEYMVAGISKFAVESLLVSLEMNTYFMISGLLTAKTGYLLSMITIHSGIGYGRMIIPIVLPLYRIYKKEKLDYLRLPKTKSECGIPVYFG